MTSISSPSNSDQIYMPGDKICLASNARSGYGTYVSDGIIYASLLGKVEVSRENVLSENSTASSTGSLPVISIQTFKANNVVIPSIGSLVVAKVTGVNPRYVKCSILSVNNIIVKENFSGQINRKDIRATEKDKIEVSRSFRCGDIIIARVISLGDTNSYFLSCAENELGVVIAYSEAGTKMVAISWNEMQCPSTMLKEYRKVAKVQSDFIDYVEQTEENVAPQAQKMDE